MDGNEGIQHCEHQAATALVLVAEELRSGDLGLPHSRSPVMRDRDKYVHAAQRDGEVLTKEKGRFWGVADEQDQKDENV